MKKILITGASGFIGAHVLPLLSEGEWEIHATSRNKIDSSSTYISWHQLDLLDRNKATELVKQIRPSHLLHLAWYHEGHSYWHSPKNNDWLEASANLTKSFLDSQGQRIVVSGTCAQELKNKTVYGDAKNELFRRVQKQCLESKGSLAWGRVFFPYGPRQDSSRLIPSIVSSLRQGEVAKCAFPNLIRDYIYVGDVARAFVKCLTSEFEGPFDIGTGVGVMLGDIAKQTCALAGFAGKVEFGTSPSNDVPVIVADTNRLNNELGFEPRTDLQTGLRLAIEYTS